MQKIGLLLGLIAAVGAAVYAYPSGDKRSGPLVKITTEAGERDGPAPTALDKLKAATRGETIAAKPAAAEVTAQPQSALPAPRVMDAVRQELSARPPAPAVAAPAPAASPVVLGNRAPAGTAPSPVDEKSVEKLASRLAAEATGPAPADKPATTLLPASISLKSGAAAATQAEVTGKQPSATAAVDAATAEAPVTKQAPAQKKSAAAARVERRKAANAGQAAVKDDRRSPMSGIARSGYAPNSVTRFDGL